ncbi:sugar ABC transporter ATP-binding protein [Paracoccus sp. R12_1]|uniref:sugar ABC transporter ATP-binding protein n=1 Tax=unclassified Paracoccus (in: a-proteobacteria) TaxID=2688777 RepID=UPI001ADCA26B|nr:MULTISPECIES: sugar ABC transporter ATP-binding protein [unclassified Paracoccus (in: a-proteobacteria)]MBO9456939.1 sugar ABC transporter ATP-binding protein [Paracoccus sp. R12_2]MBO9488032.1 sugar ABC transporter ATP-binding protein [Paracoccus sp. R12_1]
MTIHDTRGMDTADDAILRIENITKNYGPVQALRGVSLEICRGTIHGLLGENGAGKSTLVGIISGQNTPNSGRILMDGQLLVHVDVRAMEEAGVFLVTQEPMIIDSMTAAENLMLGIWPTQGGLVDWRKLRADAARMLAGSGIDPGVLAGRLDAVARRKLNILRAMFSGGRVIILDEPTAALTVADRRVLFDFMRRLKAEGVTFIFISHYNDEILEICDAVSVLRDGNLAGESDDVSALSSEQLTELVLGRGLKLFQRSRRDHDGEAPAVRLRAVVGTNLCIDALDIAPGEILGFTGLPGAGAKELARAIIGLHPASGTILLGGREGPLPGNPRVAFDVGIAYLSDDRRKDGAVGQMSIGDNIALSSLPSRARAGFIDRKAEASVVAHYFGAMGIKAPNANYAVNTLSGGNQQKVCLGRVLATNPRLLIVDEPTRGIDVGVKQDVLRIIDELSDTGVSVIIVSTDTDELVRAADRVCIFDRGSIKETLTGEDISVERLRASVQT